VSIDNVASPVAALLSGFLQQKLGPKVNINQFIAIFKSSFSNQVVLMSACFPYIGGWALAALSGACKNVTMLYMSR
jgi:hypothetical protein